MFQTIFGLLTNPLAPWIIAIWLLILAGWKERREAVLADLSEILGKPNIFEKDPRPTSVSLYRRFESGAKMFRDFCDGMFTQVMKALHEFSENILNKLRNSKRPGRLFGYLIFSVLFAGFILADFISIFGILESQGYSIPILLTLPILQNFDIAIAMGSIFSVITAGLVLLELHSVESKISEWEDQDEKIRDIARIVSWLLLISGLFVIALFGVSALIGEGIWPISWRATVEFGQLALTRINVGVATFLIAKEGAVNGIQLWIVGIVNLLYGILYGVNKLLRLLGALLPILVDILYRVVYIAVSLLFYLLFTPLLAVAYLIRKLFRK